MEIPDIGTGDIGIPSIRPVTDYGQNAPNIFQAPPVVVNIGVPVVDIPGCVEAHQSNNKSKTVGGDDSRGLVTYCDSGVPSFNPIQYEPNQMIMTRPSGVDTRQPKKPEVPQTPDIPAAPPPATAKIDCPTAAQQAKEPVGTYIEGFRKKVTDYQLVGNQCIQITEPVPIPQQIIAGLPAPGMVVTTGGIAIIATSSALLAKPLADILLKVIKPTVKKVMKKIAAIRGKSVKVLSTAERRNEQRDRNRAIMALRQTLKPK